MKKVDQQLRMDQPFAYLIDMPRINVRTNALIELDALTDQIWQDLGRQVPRARIQQVVLEVASQFHDATVTTYLPIFIRRLTRERLENKPCGDGAGG